MVSNVGLVNGDLEGERDGDLLGLLTVFWTVIERETCWDSLTGIGMTC